MTLNYDPKKVTVTVDGQVVTGYVDGTFVNCSKNEDKFSTVVGADGTVTRLRSNNEQGTIALTLKHTSPSNPMLRDLANSDREVPVFVKDNNDNSKMLAGGNECWILKPADEGRGTGIENISWNITVGKYGIK